MKVVNERRASPRAALSRDVVVYVGDQRFKCVTVDVSHGGIAVVGPDNRKPGEFLRVNFALAIAPGSPIFDADAVIVRSKKRRRKEYIWGLQFINPDPNFLAHVDAYVQAMRSGVSQARMFIKNVVHAQADGVPESTPRTDTGRFVAVAMQNQAPEQRKAAVKELLESRRTPDLEPADRPKKKEKKQGHTRELLSLFRDAVSDVLNPDKKKK